MLHSEQGFSKLMFHRADRFSLSFLPIVLTMVLLIMGCLGMLGSACRIPSTAPCRQRSGPDPVSKWSLHSTRCPIWCSG